MNNSLIRISSQNREEIGDSKYEQHFPGVVLKKGTGKRSSRRMMLSREEFYLRWEKLHHASGNNLVEGENLMMQEVRNTSDILELLRGCGTCSKEERLTSRNMDSLSTVQERKQSLCAQIKD